MTFQHDVTAPAQELQFVPFESLRQTHGFTCGDPALDEFITTDEVDTYQRMSLGNTTLVYLHGQLVAFYTISMDGLKFEYLRKRKALREPNMIEIEVLPALKIGRLAVHKAHQNRGLGRILLDRLVKIALDQEAACRLIVLNARPESIRFYQKYGFALSDHRKMKGRREKLMFLDLDYIRAL